MHFGEYELSPGLIGLSPLPSAHWNTFQRIPIRTSIRCYPDFILAKGRSPGFASTPADSTPSSDSLSLRLRGSCRLTSPARVTRRFIMQKARRHPTTGAPTACRRTGSGSVSLPCSGFFSPFPHGTGSLSVSREYLALPDGPGGFTRDSSCPALLRIPPPTGKAARKGLSPATAGRSRPFRSPSTYGPWRSYNPDGAETPTVWAVPLSLAATRGITLVFFSCGY